MELSYSKKQIKKAAKFIFKKNPMLRLAHPAHPTTFVDELRDEMERKLIELAKEMKKDSSLQYLTTGGYWLIVYREDEDYLSGEVLVDPAVGSKADFDTYTL